MIKIDSKKYYEMEFEKRVKDLGPGLQFGKHEDVCTTLMLSSKSKCEKVQDTMRDE